MNETARLLSGDFTILDLGSASSVDLPALRPIRKAITLIEIDALAGAATSASEYFKKIMIRAPIRGQAGRRVFHRRKFAQSSSFLNFKPDLVRAYGLQDFFEPDGTMEMECETLQSILGAHGLARVDFLKTDLEGIDYEVLTSAPDIVGRSLVIQSELKFQPLYVGEPDYCATAGYLANLGFELIMLRPEIWKYATRNRDMMRDGRMVWADAIFFMGLEKVKQTFQNAAPTALIKQIILAKSLSLHNYAEYLFEHAEPHLPSSVRAEIQHYLASGLARHVIRLLNGLASLPGGNRTLLFTRRLLLLAARALSVSKKFKHIAFPY